MAATSSFTEGASVFGGQANLVQAINTIFTVYEPDVIAVHTTCLSETIGDDVTQIAKKALDDIVIKKDTEQAYVYFGSAFNAKTADEDAYKAKVAAFILGSSGFGSRLMEEVRVKRGLAYSAYAMINLALSHSYFSGHLQTKLKSQDEAVYVVQEIIKEFVKNGATQKELESAKKFLLGSEPLRTETLSQRLGRSFNEYYTGKPIGYSMKELKKIDALTLDELNKYIENHKEINELTFSILTK